MPNLVSRRQNDAAVWLDILAEPSAKAAQELGYDVLIAKLLCDPSELAENERQQVEQFEAKLLEYAYQEWQANIERARQVLAAIVERRERRALAWLRVKSIEQVQAIAPSFVQIDDNSTGREITAFYSKHLASVDRAGVDPNSVMQVMARGDKLIVNTARAISRVERSADLTQTEKDAIIREVVNDAVETPTAAEFGRKWLNGHITIPCDVITIDGTRLVTFVCDTDEQWHVLNKRTDGIRDVYGNTIPILNEIRDQLERQQNEN